LPGIDTLPLMTDPNPALASPPRLPMTVLLGDPALALGALMIFGFSFAPFVRYSDQAEESLIITLLQVKPWFNAWSLETFMAPLTAFVVLAALLGITAVAVRLLLRREPALLGFRLRQVEVGLALFTFVVLLGMLTSAKHALFGARRMAEVDPTFEASAVALDTSWGGVLMLVGATLALIGAALNHFSIGPVIRLGGSPPAPPAGPDYWQGSQQPPGATAPPPTAPPPTAPLGEPPR
jgi:hypothetical protein